MACAGRRRFCPEANLHHCHYMYFSRIRTDCMKHTPSTTSRTGVFWGRGKAVRHAVHNVYVGTESGSRPGPSPAVLVIVPLAPAGKSSSARAAALFRAPSWSSSRSSSPGLHAASSTTNQVTPSGRRSAVAVTVSPGSSGSAVAAPSCSRTEAVAGLVPLRDKDYITPPFFFNFQPPWCWDLTGIQSIGLYL